MAPIEKQASAGSDPDRAARLRYLQRFVIQVQERLLASRVLDADLRKAARVLRPLDYDAVVDERVHLHRCGLPTCPNDLSEASPSAPKYRIRLSERQVVHAQPPALQAYCSSACAARGAAYRAALSDVHVQYRDIVRDPASCKPRGGPARARVVEKAPPTPTESLAATDSFAEMLFELSRIARNELERPEASSPPETIVPERVRIAPEDRDAPLSRFGRLFVAVSRWCRGPGPSLDAVLDQIRARVGRYCPGPYRERIGPDLERLLWTLDVDDDVVPAADPDWVAVSAAIIQALVRRQTQGEEAVQFCDEGCRHSSGSCMTGLLASSGYDQHHIDCLAECFAATMVD